MQGSFLLDKRKIQPIDEFIDDVQTLEEAGKLAQAIQAYDTILLVESEPALLAYANFRLGKIYREWGELFTAQRFIGQAHQLNPEDAEIQDKLAELNQYITQNQGAIFEERARKNSDQIDSLFRIATGLKLLQMDKGAQAYPLMKSRTKIYPNAAVSKHLLTDVIITEEEKNSAIEFLEERGWLVEMRSDLYSITTSGLYTFYVELAKLHVANEAYDEAGECYEQAYWLDDSNQDLLYHRVICNAKSQAWKNGLAALEQITGDLPEGVDSAEYHSAVAQIWGLAYQSTQDRAMGIQAIQACETALAINKKDKETSNLLKSLQSVKELQSDQEGENKLKKKWWPW